MAFFSTFAGILTLFVSRTTAGKLLELTIFKCQLRHCVSPLHQLMFWLSRMMPHFPDSLVKVKVQVFVLAQNLEMTAFGNLKLPPSTCKIYQFRV